MGAFLLAVPQTASAAHPGKDIKKILVLNSYHDGYAWSDGIIAGIRSAFSDDLNVNLMVEYLETKRHYSTEYFAAFKSLLALKYKDNPPDILMSTDDNAMDFALHYRSALFPEIPLIFNGIEKVIPEGHVSCRPCLPPAQSGESSRSNDSYQS